MTTQGPLLQPWSKVGPAFGVDWTHFCIHPNTFTDIMPVRKSRFRLENDELGIRLEGLGPKRSVDAQQRGIPRRDGHCMRWNAGGIYLLLTGALSSACGRSPLHPETEP